MKNVAIRMALELQFIVGLLVVFVVSISLVFPAMIYRPIWKLQTWVLDWVDDWGFEPIRRHLHYSQN